MNETWDGVSIWASFRPGQTVPNRGTGAEIDFPAHQQLLRQLQSARMHTYREVVHTWLVKPTPLHQASGAAAHELHPWNVHFLLCWVFAKKDSLRDGKFVRHHATRNQIPASVRYTYRQGTFVHWYYEYQQLRHICSLVLRISASC